MSIEIDENGLLFARRKNENKKRPDKGDSLIAKPKTYTVIDIETTGLEPDYCEIIEIAALRYTDGDLVNSFHTLIKPVVPINSFIEEFTGITNDMVKDSPPISISIKNFCDFIGNDILMGYNVSFDINFLYDEAQRHSLQLSNPYIDVMRFARKLLPQLKSHRLGDISSHYGIKNKAHRAYADCETTHACYQHLIVDITTHYNDWGEFVNSYKKRYYPSVRAKDITATASDFDEDHPLFGKVCVFTGTLEKMPRREAMQIVSNFGGKCGDNVTTKTNYLILGNNDFCNAIKDGKNRKHKKAEELILAGHGIEILSENVFYDLILE